MHENGTWSLWVFGVEQSHPYPTLQERMRDQDLIHRDGIGLGKFLLLGGYLGGNWEAGDIVCYSFPAAHTTSMLWEELYLALFCQHTKATAKTNEVPDRPS